MNGSFAIDIDWERLDHGPAEDVASYGAVGIRLGDCWLSEAHDTFVGRVRRKVHLSGYQLAQWLAWNWWRLRWEPRDRSLGWSMAHRMATIGGGYVWPNIECVSDGVRVFLLAHPTSSRGAEPLRYLVEAGEGIPAGDFERGIDLFVDRVVQKLISESIRDSNLERVWSYVQDERRDDRAAAYRTLEASMGYEPDGATPGVVEALLDDETALGRRAVRELASGVPGGEPAPRADGLRELARRSGIDADLGSIPGLPQGVLVAPSEHRPAWEVGEADAKALRRQQGLVDGPIPDGILAALAGTSPGALTGEPATASYLLAVDGGRSAARLVLQSPFRVSRRFALARLIGDRVINGFDEALTPALRSRTYRQKMQRAFAAELLCPFEQARDELSDDPSEDNQQRVAELFEVSPVLVRTQLVNNDLLDRETLDQF